MSTKVFISYAKEDKPFAEKLYKSLNVPGIKPWLDSINLLPGQDWDYTISEAIRQCRYFIALLSNNSVNKKGYVNKEIRHALEVAKEYTPKEVYIIPVRIEECEPSFEEIKRWQIINIYSDYEDGINKLLEVLGYATMVKQNLILIDRVRKKGTIKKLRDIGSGFITSDISEMDYFFHHSELNGVQYDDLKLGDMVEFTHAEIPMKKGKFAIDIERM